MAMLREQATLFNAVMATIYTAMVAGCVWVGVSISDRESPVGPVKISIEQADRIAPGGYLLIDVIVPYYRSCTGVVYRKLFDAQGRPHALPTLLLGPSEIGVQHSASRFPMAEGFSPGPAKYWSRVFYACNAFERWVWPLRQPDRWADFLVLDKTAAKGIEEP